MSEWDGIEGVAGWRDKLAELLDEARRAAQSEDRISVADRLRAFIEHSRPQTHEIQQLDDLAKGTALALMEQTIDDRLAALTARSQELAKLTLQLAATADAASASADSIRLGHAREVVNLLSRTADALNQFRAALDADNTAGLAASVEDLLARIQEVRSRIATGAVPKGASARALSPAVGAPRGRKASTRKREKRTRRKTEPAVE